GDAPVLVQDRPLQPLDEAVGPGVARQGARVPDPQGLAGCGKGGLELGAAVGEDPPERPARAPVSVARAEARRCPRAPRLPAPPRCEPPLLREAIIASANQTRPTPRPPRLPLR